MFVVKARSLPLEWSITQAPALPANIKVSNLTTIYRLVFVDKARSLPLKWSTIRDPDLLKNIRLSCNGST